MAPSRQRVRLVHWKAEEVPERAGKLEAEGFEVDGEVPGTSIGIKQLRENPPAAFVIDLGRLPSHGREVAYAFPRTRSSRPPIPVPARGVRWCRSWASRRARPLP